MENFIASARARSQAAGQATRHLLCGMYPSDHQSNRSEVAHMHATHFIFACAHSNHFDGGRSTALAVLVDGKLNGSTGTAAAELEKMDSSRPAARTVDARVDYFPCGKGQYARAMYGNGCMRGKMPNGYSGAETGRE